MVAVQMDISFQDEIKMKLPGIQVIVVIIIG